MLVQRRDPACKTRRSLVLNRQLIVTAWMCSEDAHILDTCGRNRQTFTKHAHHQGISATKSNMHRRVL